MRRLTGVALVPPRASDAAAWHVWRAEPEARRFNPFADADVEALAARIARSSPDLSSDAAEHRFTITWQGAVVGTIAARVTTSLHSAEIGYQVGAPWQGRGIATEAVRQLVARIFAETALRRITATVAAGHAASIRVLERCGFAEENRFERLWELQGEKADVLLFALQRPEAISGP